MRNLKIGAKILLGFGTVIALLVVVAVVVVVTNTAAIDNVHSIDYDSSLQTLGNTMSIAMQAARAPASRMIESTAPAYYEDFKTREEAMRQSLAAMYAFIGDHELLAKFQPGIQEAEAGFAAYAESVHEMGEINAQLVAENDEAVRIGTQLSEISGVVLANLFDALDADILALANADTLTRRAGRIREGDKVSTLVTDARMNARTLLSSADATQIDAVLTSMDAAIAGVTGYRDMAELASNQEAAQTILDALEPYREGLVHFAELCTRKAELSAQLPQIIAQAQTAVDDAMAAIDVAMVNQIQNTESAASTTLLTVILLAGVSLLIGVVLALAIMRGITGPLKDMMGYIKQAGETGNLQFRDDEWANCDRLAKGKDEIGQTMKAFTQMMRQFVYYGEAVNRVAAQDLTVEVTTLSNEDTFGNAIVQMVTQFSGMFADINMSATQVSTGATQVADGSQALAQGATEQAASIQELSSSIAEIAERTKENASKAEQASALADTIRVSAEKGASQMSEMLGAVREINESSHDIGRVIKVIDSIALQTNILSLNASVEAARAGVHGKGFAVVAEEVRSLATKSAEAAKDTESLIASSMEKAELGVRIAEETSKSLSEIVSGINENSQLVLGIADSSGEQSISVSQINIGIDQVAQVVQQNSATAEESAATAEEISAQSTVLRELIAQFKTREDDQMVGGPAERRLEKPAREAGKKITEDAQAGFGKY